MKANELRIGNYLKRLDDSIFTVSVDDLVWLIEHHSSFLKPKPILLTEQWLIKFGLEPQPLDWFKNKEGFTVSIYEDEVRMWVLNNGKPINLIFQKMNVHTFQNLIFLHTGIELQIKETVK